MIAAGDRLRDLREDKGKTQAEISSLLGTTQQIYSRYETNRTDLPLRHLIKLADYYQVSADYILGRTSYPKNPPEVNLADGGHVYGKGPCRVDDLPGCCGSRALSVHGAVWCPLGGGLEGS